MTIIEAAKLLSAHIAQGRGHWQFNVFQWDHGTEPIDSIMVREGLEVLEVYSGPVPATGDLEDLV